MNRESVSDLLVASEIFEIVREKTADPTRALALAVCASGVERGLALDEIQAMIAEGFAHVAKSADDTDPG